MVVCGIISYMASKEDFKRATEQLNFDEDAQVAYMSNPANWLTVHCTKYMPRRLPDGRLAVPTTAMATNFELPRATVHVTLNHPVRGHSGGSWNDMQFVILAPYSDLVQANGNPLQVSLFDTYFAPDVKTGLVLPADAHIVRPGDVADGALYKIQGNETIYKIDGFTQDDIQKILPRMSDMQRYEYDKLARDEIPEWEIKDMLMRAGKTAQKMYDGARDKNAFIRGMMRDGQNAILANVVRDMAVINTTEKMGYHSVTHVDDAGLVADSAARAAQNIGLDGVASNKGHFSSVAHAIENVSGDIQSVFDGDGVFDNNLISKSGDLNSLYDYINSELNHRGTRSQILDDVVRDLTGAAPIDFHKYFDGVVDEFNPEYKHSDAKNMAEYNKNISITVDNWLKKFVAQYNKWRDELKNKPGYEQFIARLRQMPDYQTRRLMRGGASRSL